MLRTSKRTGAGKREEMIVSKVRNACMGVAIIGSLAALFPAGAFAEFKPTAAQRADCMGDALSLCSSAIPNTDRIVACLAAKKSQLSPSCRAHFDKQ
jgi:hypothetical protein